MAESDDQRPIIIKKIKKSGGGGHHGGAWKVAYADFVTAMMAFFLLMWLLAVSDSTEKKGLAEYFSTSMISFASGSNDAILGGETYAVDGPRLDQVQPVGIDMNKPGVGQDKPADELTDDELRDEIAARDEEAFEEVETTIRQAMEDIPELKKLKDHLIMDQTSEGLRIQIVDQQKQSMFKLGSSELMERTDTLLRLVARVVQDLPNKLSVRGHTDSTPFGPGADYTNWELSADRANASRRVLGDAGINKKRIANVIGKADKDPLIADDPASAINRRISIILLREASSTPKQAAGENRQQTIAEQEAAEAENIDLIDTSNPGASKIFESDKPTRFGDMLDRRD